MAKDKVVTPKVEAAEEQKPVVVEDVAAENRRTFVHGIEVDAIRDSRKRDLPLFKIISQDAELLRLLSDAAFFLEDTNTLLSKRMADALADRTAACELWIVAVSEHQAKLAFIDRACPMEKVSKKDRDCRYVHLLEAKDAATTE